MANGSPKKRSVRRRPAVPPPIRTRRDVSSLPPTDPIIVFYGRAIGEMKAQPIGVPTSWRYQAAMHDYDRTDDPFASAADVLPTASEQARFWGLPTAPPSGSGCQHSSWFFLPWHRMYLHFFERIIMSHVVRLRGPADWALPYWNYSASATAARLPEAFRNPTLADGSQNHLFVAQRHPDANAGRDFATSADTDVSAALGSATFEPSGSSQGFGGPRRRFHNPGPAGILEVVPHGSIHVAVSGPSAAGFMGSFTRAPLDPIFWLHHCNIDRLWKEWRRNAAGHTDPTQGAWLNESFNFHDAAGTAVTMTAREVLDTAAAPLSYVYDDEPFGPPPP